MNSTGDFVERTMLLSDMLSDELAVHRCHSDSQIFESILRDMCVAMRDLFCDLRVTLYGSRSNKYYPVPK